MLQNTHTITATVPSIVLLDDEDAIVTAMTSLLRRQRYTIHPFTRGSDAVDFLKSNKVDIIITDMRMPEMDGREFLERVSAICPETIRVMMSGYENKDTIINAIDEGLAQYYVFKPWDDATLRQTIGEALKLQEEMRSLRLKEILKSLTTLPSPPKFQTGLWSLMSGSDKPLREIVSEIEQSPALVAKLLRVANSVFFATRQSITNVQDAVKLIGTEYVVSMAVSIEAFGAASAGVDETVRKDVEEIWDSGLRRTALARKIAQQWEGFTDHQTLHISTLLQDVGLVVRACTLPVEFRGFKTLCSAESASPYEVEREIFGSTHDAVGEAVLEYWNFPRVVCTNVGGHHGSVGDDLTLTIMQIAARLEESTSLYPYDRSLDPLIENWRGRLAKG